jgi:iron complex outermembrane recepter protein
VTEGYVEFGVPLLRDLPMMQELSTTLAGRLTDYSQSGVENMWKLGLNWTMTDNVRFRGTLSADTRAPNVIELFDTGQVTRGNFTFPSANATPSFSYLGGQNISRGNENLEPEKARTYTAGFVLSPIPSIQMSIDWYQIDLLGAIAQPGTQTVVNECYAGDQSFCELITVNGQPVTTTANITVNDYVEVINPTLNESADQSVSGIDVEVSYKTALGAGDLALRLTGNYALKDYDADSGCAVGAAGRTTDFVGAIGACGINPKIRARVSANYDIGRFGIYVQERYIDKGVLNPNYVTGIDISDNDIPAYWYTDMTLSYELPQLSGGDGEVYLNVTNLFDKEPPPTNSTAGRSWIEPTETELYDALGQRFTLGVRYRW